ncbi:MAG: hypothetical protein ACI3ZV_00135 [Paludibacteraceae bacterium]
MTKVDDTHYTIALETTEKDGYKYCSGPDWAYVEKAANGNEMGDRTYAANDVVAQWAKIYNPAEAVSYVDITIRVKASTAPNIWWWGAGDKCPNADQTKDAEENAYNWDTNHPVMTAVAGQTGWYEWVFKDVNESLGVTFKLNKGDKDIKATESTCYDESGSVIECESGSTTALQAVTVADIYANNGRIYGAEGMRIYTVSGMDVTDQNGQLNGIYIVKTQAGVCKIAVK